MRDELGSSVTPLILAAHEGQTEAAHALLAAGADATAKSSCEPSASHSSRALLLIASCVAPLISPDTVPQCSKGKNAAEVADDAGHFDLAKMLRLANPKFRRVRSALEQLQLLQLYDRLFADVRAE